LPFFLLDRFYFHDQQHSNRSVLPDEIGLDCQINISVHYALYSLFGLTYLLIGLWAVPKVYLAATRLQTRKNKQGKRPSLIENRALISLIIRLSIAVPSVLILVFVELFTQYRVAEHILPTLFFVILRSSLYLDAFLFFPFIMSKLVGGVGGSNTRALLQKNDRWSALIFIIIILAGFISFVALGTDSPLVTVYTYIAYQIIVGVSFYQMAYNTHWVKRHVSIVLDQSYKISANPNIVEVKIKLHRHLNQSRFQLFFQGTLSILQGAIPYIFSYYNYLLPLTLALPMLVWTSQVRTMDTTSKDNEKAPTREFKRVSASSSAANDGRGTAPQMHVHGLEGAENVLTEKALTTQPLKSPSSKSPGRVANDTRAVIELRPSRDAERDPSNGSSPANGGGSQRSITPKNIVNAALTPSRKFAQFHQRFLFDDVESDTIKESAVSESAHSTTN